MLNITVGEKRKILDAGMREPQLLRLSNGDLLLTFHAEGDVHFAHRPCYRSRDDGESWRLDEPQRAHREQAIGKSDDGNTVLAFDIYTFEIEPGKYLGSYYISKDGGETFEGPKRSTILINRVAAQPYPMTEEQRPDPDHPMSKFFIPLPNYYQPLVADASPRRGFSFWRYMIENDGRWVAPMQGRFHGDSFYRTVLVESNDDGATWRFVNTLAYEAERLIDGMCEPAIAEVADGSLSCVLRRGGGHPLAQTRSTDGGRTWSEPELLPGHGVDPDLVLMSNGVLACTYGRPGRFVMFSEDGNGFSWGYRTEIGDWPGSTYMGIAEINPGELYLTYDEVVGDHPDAGRDFDSCHIGATTVRVEKS